MFQVRRGRIKFNYDNVLTQFVIQADFINTGVYAQGRYIWPSRIPGCALSGSRRVSSTDRSGTRSRCRPATVRPPNVRGLFQTLFPGERDLGAKIIVAPQIGPLSMLRLDLGLFNGVGPNANEVDNFKDLSGHLALQVPFEESNAELDLGVSGYIGNVRSASKYIYASLMPARA